MLVFLQKGTNQTIVKEARPATLSIRNRVDTVKSAKREDHAKFVTKVCFYEIHNIGNSRPKYNWTAPRYAERESLFIVTKC